MGRVGIRIWPENIGPTNLDVSFGVGAKEHRDGVPINSIPVGCSMYSGFENIICTTRSILCMLAEDSGSTYLSSVQADHQD
jgi:hypothetical protein